MINKEILEQEVDKYIEALERTDSEREKEKIKNTLNDIRTKINFISFKEKFEK
jgi:hypothetical protein